MAEGANHVYLTNGIAHIQITWDKINGNLSFLVQPVEVAESSPRVFGGAVIRSAYVNGVWKRSNAQIVIMPNIGPIYTYEQWRSYYESTGVSAKYLNQGSEGTGIQG